MFDKWKASAHADPNTAARRRQFLLLGTVAVVLVAGAGVVLATDEPVQRVSSKRPPPAEFMDPRKDIKPETDWVVRGERRLKDLEAQFSRIQQQLEQERKRAEEKDKELNKARADLQSSAVDAKKVIDAQAEEIRRLQTAAPADNARLKSAQALASPATAVGSGDLVRRNGPVRGPDLRSAAVPAATLPGGVEQVKLALADRAGKDDSKSIVRYVPAGAYAKARIISGVDATAGVVAQADARPLLLRVKDAAITADFEGEEQSIDIKGCTVTGAGWGELSSEKVYVRLQKLTCSYESGKVIEKDVKAYVAGSGKAGVRGIVVSREGDFITTALVAGVVGGFGRGLAQAGSQPSYPSNGITINNTAQERTTGEIFQQGIGQGLSRGTDRIADYLIRRAEQYQPVIVLGSGQDVEIVFLEGVDLK